MLLKIIKNWELFLEGLHAKKGLLLLYLIGWCLAIFLFNFPLTRDNKELFHMGFRSKVEFNWKVLLLDWL